MDEFTKPSLSRRGFVKAAVGGTVVASLPELRAEKADRAFVVRKDVTKLSEKELKDFEAGVSAMRKLAKNDPMNWDNFAEIHFRDCPHGNWFFLPWHRAYLYYFELICRKLTDNPGFALPYWDWSTHPNIPAAFLNQKSPLYHDNRTAACKVGPAKAHKVGLAVVNRILASTDFIVFAGGAGGGVASNLRNSPEDGGAGELEDRPHNHIHEFVGREPSGRAHKTMFGQRAPLDPLFWVHHSNVDRLWTKWCYLPPPKDKRKEWPNKKENWHGLRMKFVPVTPADDMIKVENCLSTLDLSYTYDEFETRGQPFKHPTSVVAFSERDAKVSASVETQASENIDLQPKKPVAKFLLGMKDRFQQELDSHLAVSRASGKGLYSSVRLRITFDEIPRDGGTILIYVNNPSAGQDTPTMHDSYAGFISFLPHAEHEHNRAHRKRVSYLDLQAVLLRTSFSPRNSLNLLITLVLDSEDKSIEKQLVTIRSVRAEIVGSG